MKLVDILASELKHWPSTRTAAVGQSNSGSLHLNEEPRHGSEFFGWTTCKFTMAEDCQSAWVTRAEWQAAVDALKVADGIADAKAGNLTSLDDVKDKWLGKSAEIKWPDGAEFMGSGQVKGLEHFYRNITDGYYEVSCDFFGWQRMTGSPAHTPLIPRPTERAVEWDGVGCPTEGQRLEVSYAVEGFSEWHKATCVTTGKDPEGRDLIVCKSDFGVVSSFRTLNLVRKIRTQEQIAADERKSEILEMIDTFGLDTAIWGRDAVMEICGHLWGAGYRKQVAK